MIEVGEEHIHTGRNLGSDTNCSLANPFENALRSLLFATLVGLSKYFCDTLRHSVGEVLPGKHESCFPILDWSMILDVITIQTGYSSETFGHSQRHIYQDTFIPEA